MKEKRSIFSPCNCVLYTITLRNEPSLPFVALLFISSLVSPLLQLPLSLLAVQTS